MDCNKEIPMTEILDIATTIPRKYFETNMLDDALLRTYVTPNIADEANRYVESVAQSMGVKVEEIVTPTPYMISRLALTFAYMTAAQRKAMFTKGGSVGNTHNQVVDYDSFALKYKLYRDELNYLLKQITPYTFRGGKPAKQRVFPFVLPISRN